MSINKKALIERVSLVTGQPKNEVETFLEATLEEIISSLKQGESVSIQNFGTFYIQQKRESCVFKFNPSQRLRKILGWSSTYKGEI
jgi:DNA-binding protein HU-beta